MLNDRYGGCNLNVHSWSMAGASLDEIVAIKLTQTVKFQRPVWRRQFGNRYNRIQLVAVGQALQHEHVNAH